MGSVLSEEGLLQELSCRRQKQERIVSTNGCFDILHVGHLRYLQAAKALGEVLVVAVNGDASVQALKGPTRPVNTQNDRAELLAGLACVDYVVLFHEDSPINLLERIRPDIYVKGGDYTLDSLPEASRLQAMGTDIHFVPMVPGRSTTRVIEKVKTP